ncbi:hypothetical protein C8A00DRAFT_38614 [Chaetomidium leptoderma]|uniref:Uncharacterized protein n=1 Tax=Chaetomidium leptoderma TaxID=669021 RepID=A0AAN6VES3_9PEZI|nr:hypothetical protein C8A00DRAFT_38614 [Chaetomidium leptoderma]
MKLFTLASLSLFASLGTAMPTPDGAQVPRELQGTNPGVLATCSGGTGVCIKGRCSCPGFCEGACSCRDRRDHRRHDSCRCDECRLRDKSRHRDDSYSWYRDDKQQRGDSYSWYRDDNRYREESLESSLENTVFDHQMHKMVSELRRCKVEDGNVASILILHLLLDAVLDDEFIDNFADFQNSAAKGVWYCCEGVLQRGHNDTGVKAGHCFCRRDPMMARCVEIQKVEDVKYG